VDSFSNSLSFVWSFLGKLFPVHHVHHEFFCNKHLSWRPSKPLFGIQGTKRIANSKHFFYFLKMVYFNDFFKKDGLQMATFALITGVGLSYFYSFLLPFTTRTIGCKASMFVCQLLSGCALIIIFWADTSSE
jgi:hypothetical protein